MEKMRRRAGGEGFHVSIYLHTYNLISAQEKHAESPCGQMEILKSLMDLPDVSWICFKEQMNFLQVFHQLTS